MEQQPNASSPRTGYLWDCAIYPTNFTQTEKIMATQNLWNPPRDQSGLDTWGLANRVDHDDISKAIALKSSVISKLTVTASGSGYTSAPTVTIGPPNLSGGIQATADFTIVNNQLQLNLTNPGLGYTSAPMVTDRKSV